MSNSRWHVNRTTHDHTKDNDVFDLKMYTRFLEAISLKTNEDLLDAREKKKFNFVTCTKKKKKLMRHEAQ